jgi:ubiquinone/menaquinone biosynthesis C-methylase UbiE
VKNSDTLEKTAEFWNSTPCDGQGAFDARAKFRYGKEPWLLSHIQKIAKAHRRIVEIGCGQGTDAITFCKLLPVDGEYHGVDYSEESLRSARSALEESRADLNVIPKFSRENAEALTFHDSSLECIYSMGVLHHTPDTRKAISEVHRVLKPGGSAYIILYRTASPKLLAAHALRGVQRAIDRTFGADRSIYRLSRRTFLTKPFGTAIEECFGVPVLRSYTHQQILRLFSDFSSVEVSSHGAGLPPLPFHLNELLEPRQQNPIGYFWLVSCRK